MKCKHDSAYHVRVLNATLLGCPITLVCDRCKVNLSLGPSTDTPSTAIELRAAEIAANLEGNGCEMSWLETCGFNDEMPTTRGGGVVRLDLAAIRAGYLAHAIVNHEGEQG